MTAINLDDELALDENRLRGRLVTLLVLLVVASAIALALYFFYFRDDSTVTARATEDLPIKKGTINQTLLISGVADAQLNSNLVFRSSGKVAFVNVKPGDRVRQGDVLASLESDDLANAVQTARANQQAAQLKLDKLLAGPTAAELAAADQALAQAQATFTKAQNDYNDLLAGGSPADRAAAEQAVRAAEAQLATAQSNKDKLANTPSDADIAAAQAAVASAQSALTAAQSTAANAANALASAETGLQIAENAYCASDSTPAFCTTHAVPVSAADITLLSGASSQQATGVISANTQYLNAVNTKNSADASVSSAEQSLAAAQAKLDLVNRGPTAAELAAADAAVTSAQAALTAAQDKLNTLTQGGTPSQRETLAAALDSAGAALAAAQAKRDDTYRGATANDIAQARQAVESARLQVEAAQIRLRDAQITAPFDGVVAAVNIKPGEFSSGGAGAAAAAGTTGSAAPIVLLTPDALTLKINVGETDFASIKPDLRGVVFFDGLPGKPYPFKIISVGLNPATTNGVVTYEVRASLTVLPDNPRPAPGMNARGQIVTSTKNDVLILPSRAIRRRGNDQIVDVRRANGAVEEQVVTTGVSDGENVEAVSGLSEGDTVVVAKLSGATTGANSAAKTPLPGGVR